MKFNWIFTLNTAVIITFLFIESNAQTPRLPEYHIYAGNTHAHTIITKSHGAHWEKIPNSKPYIYVDSSGVSHSKNTTLKPDWRKYQDLPSEHFSKAKEEGYDFYITTDHSQESNFHPTSPISAAWLMTEREADQATDANFVAIRGYEHSENNGPGGKGHINVFNTATYLNALEKGVDLRYLYKWLDTVSSNGDGPVVASFNHPDTRQYDNWAYRDPQISDIITLLEVINSNWRIHEKGFIKALDAGWKVSPIAGNDNHNLSGISDQNSRTFVLATRKTKEGILEAMKHRRTYAAMDRNIQVRYTVNGQIMGSTIDLSDKYVFNIHINDPDVQNPDDMITKIEIVGDKGEVVQTYTPDPGFSVDWSPVVEISDNAYFFIRIWNAGGGDNDHSNPENPMAWLAPVWITR